MIFLTTSCVIFSWCYAQNNDFLIILAGNNILKLKLFINIIFNNKTIFMSISGRLLKKFFWKTINYFQFQQVMDPGVNLSLIKKFQ